jgi:hypothetical protein
VLVTDLTGDKVTILVRRWVSSEAVAEQVESDLRLAIAERL